MSPIFRPRGGLLATLPTQEMWDAANAPQALCQIENWRTRSMTAFRLPVSVTAGLIMLTAMSGTGHGAVTEEDFVSKTTGALASLCSAAPTDKLYTAAVNFCHGFGAGAYGMMAAAQQADPKLNLFCTPPDLTRNEAVAAIVSWAGGRPERAALPAIDGIAAFLTETYPCPKGANATPTRRTK
jgi:hypothetical protein